MEDLKSLDNIMIRPCYLYKDEYKECKSLRGRFHQKYVHGQELDCSKWKDDYNNCLQFEKTNEQEFLKQVQLNELERVNARLESRVINNVWEYRSEAPSDWNSPLPDHLQPTLPHLRDYSKKSLCTIS